MTTPLPALALALVALGAGSALNLSLAEGRASKPYDVTYVPSAAATRLVALGHRTLASDLYWLSAVQYIGEPKADARGWDQLLPLIDLVTDLDPRHGYAYQTGGIVLSAVGRIDESNRILEKGIARGPPYWSFPYYVSFNYWFYLGDYAKAASYARVAASRPNASTNISSLAVALSAQSGTPALAVQVLRELRATVKDEVTAQKLDEQLALATMERDAQVLDTLIARYARERGAPPRKVEDLVRAGYLAALPGDPLGGSWLIGDDGRVRSSARPLRILPGEGAPERHEPGLQYQLDPNDLRRMPD